MFDHFRFETVSKAAPLGKPGAEAPKRGRLRNTGYWNLMEIKKNLNKTRPESL